MMARLPGTPFWLDSATGTPMAVIEVLEAQAEPAPSAPQNKTPIATAVIVLRYMVPLPLLSLLDPKSRGAPSRRNPPLPLPQGNRMCLGRMIARVQISSPSRENQWRERQRPQRRD